MNKIKNLLTLCSAVFLISCSGGGNSYLGKYKFQMGKDKGTNMGVFMELLDEDVKGTVDGTEQTLGKKFTLSMHMSGMGDSSSSVASFLGNDFNLDGYYRIEKDRVLLGSNNLSNLIGGDEGSTFDLEPKYVEKVLYATVDSSKLSITLPVSVNDLIYQLYWYGYRIDLSADTLITDLPESEHHEIGSHPTSEQVEAIKTKETAAGSDFYSSFRDYHTLTMGLIK